MSVARIFVAVSQQQQHKKKSSSKRYRPSVDEYSTRKYLHRNKKLSLVMMIMRQQFVQTRRRENYFHIFFYIHTLSTAAHEQSKHRQQSTCSITDRIHPCTDRKSIEEPQQLNFKWGQQGGKPSDHQCIDDRYKQPHNSVNVTVHCRRATENANSCTKPRPHSPARGLL